ncbi:hypothetical protein [Segnochrobactrum spirostomi]|uniref:Uncharacterized protein n=1 Tax=Segnochrobactrum spirostomi TaxID=2608987 RepID=A0A6A7Y5K6_9HYPH|nr:hypothetical protein [Segnochrobactrum spirostomi]MQT14493.1 hypothetical protein [Segnochrobactrum spirostomi]
MTFPPEKEPSNAASPSEAARFEALVAAYGADPARWPQERRAAALTFAATEAGRALLDRARALDDALLRLAVPPPSRALEARVLAAGPRRVALRVKLRRLLIGSGLVGIGMAGLLTGAAAVFAITPAPVVSGSEISTAFGSLETDTRAGQEGP